MLTFHLSDSTERPTWPTLALILHWVNCSLFYPVYFSGEVIGLKSYDVSVVLCCKRHIVRNKLSLLSSPVSELIKPNSWSLTWSLIKSEYLGVCLGKLNVSELIFFYCGVVLSMTSDVGLESVLEKGRGLCGTNQCCNYDFVLHINYKILILHCYYFQCIKIITNW